MSINAKFIGVLLKLDIYLFFSFLYTLRLVGASRQGTTFLVDHNLPSVDPSIIIYLDRHVIFPSYIPYERLIILDERSILITSLVYYFSVDHNLPSVDHHVPYSPCQFFLHIIPYVWSIRLDQSMRFFSKAVIFFSSDMVSERSIVIYLVSLILCQKCHPLKIFSTNQIEPSIKSYEHFKF